MISLYVSNLPASLESTSRQTVCTDMLSDCPCHCRNFTDTALTFSMTILNAVIDLVSFSEILYTIYPPLFVVLVVYSVGGTAISLKLGQKLVGLNFQQEAQEANYRYSSTAHHGVLISSLKQTYIWKPHCISISVPWASTASKWLLLQWISSLLVKFGQYPKHQWVG